MTGATWISRPFSISMDAKTPRLNSAPSFNGDGFISNMLITYNFYFLQYFIFIILTVDDPEVNIKILL